MNQVSTLPPRPASGGRNSFFRRWRRLGAAVAAVLCGSTAQAQTSPDTLAAAHRLTPLDSLVWRGQRAYWAAGQGVERLRRQPVVQKLALPALLIGTGAVIRHEIEVFELEVEVDKVVRREARQHLFWVRTHLDDHLRHVPGLASVGLSLVGVKGRHSTVEQGLLFFMVYHLNNGLTSNFKRLAGVERPYGNDFSSFPSSHTSAAFSAARLLQREYGDQSVWYSVGGYSVAVATGALRIAKDNHWLSDVLAGAGVGILSTELVYWAYPTMQRTATQLWRKVGGKGSLGSHTMLVPFYGQGAAGATLVVSLR